MEDRNGNKYKYRACYKCELCKKRFCRDIIGGKNISDSKTIRIVDNEKNGNAL